MVELPQRKSHGFRGSEPAPVFWSVRDACAEAQEAEAVAQNASHKLTKGEISRTTDGDTCAVPNGDRTPATLWQ